MSKLLKISALVVLMISTSASAHTAKVTKVGCHIDAKEKFRTHTNKNQK